MAAGSICASLSQLTYCSSGLPAFTFLHQVSSGWAPIPWIATMLRCNHQHCRRPDRPIILDRRYVSGSLMQGRFIKDFDSNIIVCHFAHLQSEIALVSIVAGGDSYLPGPCYYALETWAIYFGSASQQAVKCRNATMMVDDNKPDC